MSWEEAIKPVYDYAEDFSDGIAWVSEKEKYKFIDRGAKIVIHAKRKLQLDNVSRCKRVVFSNGKGKCGYFDNHGCEVIKPQFDMAFHFSQNRAVVMVKAAHGIIDPMGNVIYKGPEIIEPCFSDDRVMFRSGDKVGYFDLKGQVAIRANFDTGLPFHGGYAKAIWNGRPYIINRVGDIVFSLRKFVQVGKFSAGLAPALIKNRWGFIDTSGNVVLDPKYQSAHSFHNVLAAVSMENRWHFVDRNGNLFGDFARARSFCNGFAAVRIMWQWGLVDNHLCWVIKPQFSDCGFVKQNYLSVQKNDRWGYWAYGN